MLSGFCGIHEFFKILPPQAILSSGSSKFRRIFTTSAIRIMVKNVETNFIKLQGGRPLYFKKETSEYQWFNGKGRPTDWYHFLPQFSWFSWTVPLRKQRIGDECTFHCC
jgi:hypothetical protein